MFIKAVIQKDHNQCHAFDIKKLDDMGTIPSNIWVQKPYKEKDSLNCHLFISKIESIISNLLKQESPNPCRLTDKSYQIFKAEMMPISSTITQG